MKATSNHGVKERETMAESPKAPRKTAATKTTPPARKAASTKAPSNAPDKPRGSADEGALPAGANQDTQAGRAAGTSTPPPEKAATTTADAGDAGHPGGDADGAAHHRTPTEPVTAADAPEVDLGAGNTLAYRRVEDKDPSDVPTEDRAAKTADAGVAGREGDKDEAHLPPPNTVQWGIDYASKARSSAAPLAAPGGKTTSRSAAWGVEPIMSTPEVTAGKGDAAPAAPEPRLAPDYAAEQYVDDDGKKITTASGIFDESGQGTMVTVKKGVWEDITPRNAVTSIRRRVFARDQEVPRSLVAQFKAGLKGDFDDHALIV